MSVVRLLTLNRLDEVVLPLLRGCRQEHQLVAVDDREESRRWLKFAGLGFEFVGVTLLFGYFGYLADRELGTEPRWLLIGGGIGFVGGLYLMLKASWPMFRDENRRRK